MTPKYQINQEVFHASYKGVEDTIVCPDCNGEKFIRFTLWDGTPLSVDCRGCERGYYGSQGFLTYFNMKPVVELLTITGVSIEKDKVTYSADGCYCMEEDTLFLQESDARAYAEELSKKATAEDVKRALAKTKDHKSWAWHVTYHRNAIRRAVKEIDYHTSKLNVAKKKVKEE